MINAYDFDGTIYSGDSSVDFYFYCLKKNKRVLRQLPVQLFAFILYLFRIIDKTTFKEKIFSFLKQIDNVDLYIKDFWEIHKEKIYPWYLKQKKSSDVIISASPEFLLKPIGKELGVEVIASVVDKKTGKFLKKNCHDYEKVIRFEEKHKKNIIDQFYSDSIKSDRPMLEYANEAYLVENGKVSRIAFDKQEIILSKGQGNLLKLLLLISWPTLGLFITITYNKLHILLNSVVILIVLLFLLKKINFRKLNKKLLLISALLACYTDKLFLTFFLNRIDVFQDLFIRITSIESIKFVSYTLVSIMIYPTILFCIYWFINKVIPHIICEFRTITKVEKKFLLIVFVIATVFSVGTTLFTSAFHAAEYYGVSQNYDIIYTTDNGYIANYDAWTNFENTENDIRQPLFTVFSLPFSIPSHVVSEFVFFVPRDLAFFTVMSIVQYMLLALTTIMIARLMKIKEKDKKYLYLLFSLSFPYVLFGLLLEQYVICLFYLIATIYYYYENKDKINYLYLGAVGTLLTSGMLVPFITKYNSYKDWFKKVLTCFVTFITLLILSGQLAQLFTLKEKIKSFSRFTGERVTLIDKINQYTNFVKSIFFAPHGYVTENTYNMVSYQLDPVKTISVLGIVIIILVTISFILNHKDKMAKISFFWILFSIVILVFVGWGTAENGLILYSTYFLWAFYTLYFMLLNRLKNRNIFKILITISIIIMMIFMSLEMLNILKFAFYYFPR